jgi:hypothetical protein
MLDRAAEAFDALSTVGNEPGVRFLRADVTAIPPYQGGAVQVESFSLPLA